MVQFNRDRTLFIENTKIGEVHFMEHLDIDLKEEIFEALNFTVNSGYFSKEQIIEYSEEYLEEIFTEYDYDLPDNKMIVKLISEIYEAPIINPTGNQFKRLQHVLDQLNQEAIIALDYAGFDQSEGQEDVAVVVAFMKKNNIPRKGYCFFHQQDIERSMDPEIRTLYLSFSSIDGDEEQALVVGNRIKKLLETENFDVQWNGSLEQRIMIQNFIWDKEFDQEDSHVDRALRLIDEAYLV